MGRGPCRGARRRRHRQLGRRPTGDRPRPRGDGRRHPANSTGSTTASNAAHPETKHPETKEAEAPATSATAAALTRQRRARGPCGGKPSHHTTPEAAAGTWPTRPTPNQDQPQWAPPPGPPARALPRCRLGGGSGRSLATVRSRPLGPSLAPRRRAVQVVQSLHLDGAAARCPPGPARAAPDGGEGGKGMWQARPTTSARGRPIDHGAEDPAAQVRQLGPERWS